MGEEGREWGVCMSKDLGSVQISADAFYILFKAKKNAFDCFYFCLFFYKVSADTPPPSQSHTFLTQAQENAQMKDVNHKDVWRQKNGSWL